MQKMKTIKLLERWNLHRAGEIINVDADLLIEPRKHGLVYELVEQNNTPKPVKPAKT